ncbi:MAG: hypothetical protein JOY90_25415 [Bradyrhizobium sp.]|uniref:hypothetical protein n=1 Tax=Bradyrhizobium sp. TaxID=376 RepID=UPI001D539FFA|nr:hypothetical protein [Bradyrhizobium sp.]MBV9563755.1 hypothetical protein [Bradyrhizobium sp.]
MLALRRRARGASRLSALRELYRNFLCGDDPETRGLRLLREWLSPLQRDQFDTFGYFEVTGCHSGIRYRIHSGRSANIEQLDDTGRPHVGWCFVPSGYLVQGDIMLAQKIALETSERAALAIANRFPPSSTIAPRAHRRF